MHQPAHKSSREDFPLLAARPVRRLSGIVPLHGAVHKKCRISCFPRSKPAFRQSPAFLYIQKLKKQNKYLQPVISRDSLHSFTKGRSSDSSFFVLFCLPGFPVVSGNTFLSAYRISFATHLLPKNKTPLLQRRDRMRISLISLLSCISAGTFCNYIFPDTDTSHQYVFKA